jgi:AcrR family transcriptional regulator
MPRTATDARQRILETASQLFYQQGIRAVGVDTIIAQSEVAKTTLYRYFPSKDDLVVAYLEDRNQRFWTMLEDVVQRSSSPKQQLLALLTWLDGLLASDDSYGCPFLMVATEFPEPDYPGHQVAIVHKNQLRDRLMELAQASGIPKAKALSSGLMLLIDGAFAQRRLYQTHQVKLKPQAALLIQAYEQAGSAP